jgi:hypothetical protein
MDLTPTVMAISARVGLFALAVLLGGCATRPVTLVAPADADPRWVHAVTSPAQHGLPRVEYYIDKDTLQADTVQRAFWLRSQEANPTHGTQVETITYWQVNCATGMIATSHGVSYLYQSDRTAVPVPVSSHAGPAVPGSLGEAMLRAVCSTPSAL